MSKYYKAEDIERILKELSEEPNYLHPEEDWLDGICMVETRVESLPTINIVHCGECKYYEDPNHKIFENCVKWKDSHGIILPIKPNDFCSYGERIDNE